MRLLSRASLAFLAPFLLLSTNAYENVTVATAVTDSSSLLPVSNPYDPRIMCRHSDPSSPMTVGCCIGHLDDFCVSVNSDAEISGVKATISVDHHAFKNLKAVVVDNSTVYCGSVSELANSEQITKQTTLNLVLMTEIGPDGEVRR